MVIDYVYDAAGNILEIKRSTVDGLAIFDFTPRKANRLTFGLHYDVFVWQNVASQDISGRVSLAF